MLLLLVNSLHELADDEGHTLNSLDFFLSADEFSLQTPANVLAGVASKEFRQFNLPLLILDVLFL